MKTTPVQSLRPCDCKSLADICALEYSHKSVGKWDILIQHDGALILTEHEAGKPQTASITIPRRVFRQFLDWYEREQTRPT